VWTGDTLLDLATKRYAHELLAETRDQMSNFMSMAQLLMKHEDQFDQKLKESLTTVCKSSLIVPKQCIKEGEELNSSLQLEMDVDERLWMEEWSLRTPG
jgi:ribosomal protein L16 Arg81 hydroxylase